jgi:hypothetical protein
VRAALAGQVFHAAKAPFELDVGGAQGVLGFGPGFRGIGRWGRPGEDLLRDFGHISLVEAGAQEDVLPPEREEEAEVGRVDRASSVTGGEGGGGAGDGGGNRGPIRRKGLVLLPTGELDLRAAPRGGPGGARVHDEGDALPQAVDVGAAELVGAAEVGLDLSPMGAELEKDGSAAGGVAE